MLKKNHLLQFSIFFYKLICTYISIIYNSNFINNFLKNLEKKELFFNGWSEILKKNYIKIPFFFKKFFLYFPQIFNKDYQYYNINVLKINSDMKIKNPLLNEFYSNSFLHSYSYSLKDVNKLYDYFFSKNLNDSIFDFFFLKKIKNEFYYLNMNFFDENDVVKDYSIVEYKFFEKKFYIFYTFLFILKKYFFKNLDYLFFYKFLNKCFLDYVFFFFLSCSNCKLKFLPTIKIYKYDNFYKYNFLFKLKKFSSLVNNIAFTIFKRNLTKNFNFKDSFIFDKSGVSFNEREFNLFYKTNYLNFFKNLKINFFNSNTKQSDFYFFSDVLKKQFDDNIFFNQKMFVKTNFSYFSFNLFSLKIKNIIVHNDIFNFIKNKILVKYSQSSFNKILQNNNSLLNLNIFFLRKNKIFNKGRYSRNRQTYRTGFYWCLWVNIIVIYGLHYLFYRFTFSFGYLFLLLFLFFFTFFFSRLFKYNLFTFNNILKEIYLNLNWFTFFFKFDKNLFYQISFKFKKFFKNLIFFNFINIRDLKVFNFFLKKLDVIFVYVEILNNRYFLRLNDIHIWIYLKNEHEKNISNFFSLKYYYYHFFFN